MAEEVAVLVLNGFATVTVAAGFTVRKIETGQKQPRRVHFVNPPINSCQGLLDWICKITSCRVSDVAWHAIRTSSSSVSQNGSSTLGIVVFRSEALAVKAHLNYVRRSRFSARHGTYQVLVKMLEGNLKDLLKDHGVFPSKIMNIRPTRCLIQFTDVPETMNDTHLQVLLNKHRLPKPGYTISTRPFNGAYNIILTFYGTIKGLEKIIFKCKSIPELKTTFQVTVRNKWNKDVERQITHTTKCNETLEPAVYVVTFPTCQEADSLYLLTVLGQGDGRFQVDGQATVIVRHPQVLFYLEEYLRVIESAYSVTYTMGRTFPDVAQEVRFNDHFPSVCDEAARVLRNVVAPIKLNFETRDLILMCEELRAIETFQRWASRRAVIEIEERVIEGSFVGINIYGEAHQLGQFMASLADYHKEFLKRYHLVALSASANCLFRKGNPGGAELKKLIEETKSDAIQIIHHSLLSSIEVAVKPIAERSPSDIISDYVTAIHGIESKFSRKSPTTENCVYCSIHSDTKFSACGHPYCVECLRQVVEIALSAASVDGCMSSEEAEILDKKLKTDMGCCPACEARISIKDLQQSLPKSTMQTACVTFAKLHLAKVDQEMGVCPVPLCDAFVPRQAGYSSCPLCKQSVCAKCGVVKDNNHRGVACEEYQRRIKRGKGVEFLESIIDNAKKYVRDIMKSNLTLKNITLDVNPGLQNGCMALQRYCTGIQRVGIVEYERNAIFAWYGTHNAAIPVICDDGFDPETRRTQAFGPGECFHVDAEVSFSYNNDCERLIVVQLIRGTAVKKIENFCYVVNNPADRTYAFSLPVLVVSFNKYEESEIPWVLGEKRVLQYPFNEPPPVVSSADNEEATGLVVSSGACSQLDIA